MWPKYQVRLLLQSRTFFIHSGERAKMRDFFIIKDEGSQMYRSMIIRQSILLFISLNKLKIILIYFFECNTDFFTKHIKR